MKRFTLFLVIVLLTANVFAQGKVETAQKAIDKKDYKTAFAIAKEMVDANDGNNASRILIQLRQLDYPDIKLFEYLGDAYSQMGVNELAISNFLEAEAKDSMNVPLKFKTAKMYEKQKRWTDAINKYLKIIAIDPKNSAAYVGGASIMFQAKRYADAAILYEKYLEIDQSKEAYLRITRALLETKNYEKAYTFGVKGVELNPTEIQLKKSTALAAYALKKYSEAAKYYSSVPDSNLAVNELESTARSFQQIKDDVNSMKYFEKVVKLDSTRSSIYMELANGFFRDKNYDSAAKYYLAKAKVDSTNEIAWRYLGLSYFQLKESDSAKVNHDYKIAVLEKSRHALLKSIALNDTNFTTRSFLIQTYRGMDSTSAVLTQYKELLSIIGNRDSEYKDWYLEANSGLAYAAYERKNYAGAIPYLLKMLKYRSNADLLLMISSCYLQSGNNDAAIDYARRVLKISPNHKDAKKILRSLSAD
jgi:tetratricopeptide (TPR) repeat protein